MHMKNGIQQTRYYGFINLQTLGLGYGIDL